MQHTCYLSLDVWDCATQKGPVDWTKLGIIASFDNDMKDVFCPWNAVEPSTNIKTMELQDLFMKLALGLERKVV